MNLQEWMAKGKEKLLSFGIKQWGMMLLAGICCLVIVFPMGDEEKEAKEENNNRSMAEQHEMVSVREDADYIKQQESRLEEILSGVKGVGKVRVMITANRTVQKNVLQDGSREQEQLTETDSAGGTRTSVGEKWEGTTVFYDIEGDSVPYILSETYPEITGVVVIAEGSGTGTVDLDILNAVQVLFDVPAHKIKIMKMK
ncbi:MAG: stage III sporulation protein AG [Lachnospiraceae bacterium]|nr:stage III sporulation protein AG [Lachnospiraceae bacterium]